MVKKIRVVHYLNQFFAGIGGEEKANLPPFEREGALGPGLALKAALGTEGEIVATVVCGDSYFNENLDQVSHIVVNMIAKHNPDLVVAGPAFNAGRYGMACGAVAKAVWEQIGIPTVSGMYGENPGVDLYRKFAYIVETGNSAATMRQALPKIARLALKLGRKEEIWGPEEEGYLRRGVRRNVFVERRGSQRALDMLAAKLKNLPFETEYPLPFFDRVKPADAVPNVQKIKVALVTSGGIVPKGNPDRIESSSASKYGKYSLTGIDDLRADSYETAHGGYDPTYANEDSDRVLPVDVLRELEAEGEIGELHPYFYSTTGNGTSVANAVSFAQEIAAELVNEGVQAVILTSTWGTCTRCGATMVKEIERKGLPVVHLCTVVPISLTVGANRIVPTVAIPHPLGNPVLDPQQEKKLRRRLVKQALHALETTVQEQTVFEKQ